MTSKPESAATPFVHAKPETAKSSDNAPDPFNLDALRLPPSFAETAGVKKVLSTVPVRKPHKQEWIRVHPSEDYRGEFATILLKDEGEFYLVTPGVAVLIENEISRATIFTAINRSGIVFLWPVRLPDGNRRSDTWRTSEREGAEAAMTRLIRLKANMKLGAYEYAISDNETSNTDPVWPDLPFVELVRLGFQKTGRFVEDFEHPVIKDLCG